MIDIRLVRDDTDLVTRALARRGVDPAEVAAIVALDIEARALVGSQESIRAKVKALSRQVGEAKKTGDEALATKLAEESRALGDEERLEAANVLAAQERLRDALLYLPNLPADDCPDGAGPDDNVDLRHWWPGMDAGAPEPQAAAHQRVPHWEIAEQLGLLDLERGAKLSGSMFPVYRGVGARLLRALSSLALSRHSEVYEEIRPPTLVRTETMISTGHLPKFSDDAYHLERDDLWAIPTAEVPLTSMYRDEILSEADLPMRLCALSACFRRESGSAGRDTRGVLRVHEFDKVELFAYATPEQAPAIHADILARAEDLLQALGLTYRVLDLCAGDIGNSAARTFDLEVYAPGTDAWLEVSSVSWFRDYQARRANIRYRDHEGILHNVHTLNGSALAWGRVWAALLETGRQEDGSVHLPEVLAPWLGNQLVIGPPA